MLVHNTGYVVNVQGSKHSKKRRSGMRSSNSTQFGIGMETKNRLDKYKWKCKEDIIQRYKKKRRYVSNDDVVRYLLDVVEKERK